MSGPRRLSMIIGKFSRDLSQGWVRHVMLVAHGSLNNIAEVPNRGFYCPLLDYSMTDEIINRKTSTLIIEKESWSSFSHDKKK